jgi:hypothetical protein
LGTTIEIPLDFTRSTVLEKLEFTFELPGISEVLIWLDRTLRTVTSPLLNELALWILDRGYSWSRLYSGGGSNDWEVVDASLNVLAKRNTDFRVVFRGDFGRAYDLIRQSVGTRYLPLVSSKGIVGFECVPYKGNRFRTLGVL